MKTFRGYLAETRMPSTVIKHKQRLAEKTPEELHKGFKEVADRDGKTVEHVARSTAWRHGYGQMHPHYWDKIKHIEPKNEELSSDDEALIEAALTRDGIPYHKVALGSKGYHLVVHHSDPDAVVKLMQDRIRSYKAVNVKAIKVGPDKGHVSLKFEKKK